MPQDPQDLSYNPWGLDKHERAFAVSRGLHAGNIDDKLAKAIRSGAKSWQRPTIQDQPIDTPLWWDALRGVEAAGTSAISTALFGALTPDDIRSGMYRLAGANDELRETLLYDEDISGGMAKTVGDIAGGTVGFLGPGAAVGTLRAGKAAQAALSAGKAPTIEMLKAIKSMEKIQKGRGIIGKGVNLASKTPVGLFLGRTHGSGARMSRYATGSAEYSKVGGFIGDMAEAAITGGGITAMHEILGNLPAIGKNRTAMKEGLKATGQYEDYMKWATDRGLDDPFSLSKNYMAAFSMEQANPEMGPINPDHPYFDIGKGERLGQAAKNTGVSAGLFGLMKTAGTAVRGQPLTKSGRMKFGFQDPTFLEQFGPTRMREALGTAAEFMALSYGGRAIDMWENGDPETGEPVSLWGAMRDSFLDPHTALEFGISTGVALLPHAGGLYASQRQATGKKNWVKSQLKIDKWEKDLESLRTGWRQAQEEHIRTGSEAVLKRMHKIEERAKDVESWIEMVKKGKEVVEEQVNKATEEEKAESLEDRLEPREDEIAERYAEEAVRMEDPVAQQSEALGTESEPPPFPSSFTDPVKPGSHWDKARNLDAYAKLIGPAGKTPVFGKQTPEFVKTLLDASDYARGQGNELRAVHFAMLAQHMGQPARTKAEKLFRLRVQLAEFRLPDDVAVADMIDISKDMRELAFDLGVIDRETGEIRQPTVRLPGGEREKGPDEAQQQSFGWEMMASRESETPADREAREIIERYSIHESVEAQKRDARRQEEIIEEAIASGVEGGMLESQPTLRGAGKWEPDPTSPSGHRIRFEYLGEGHAKMGGILDQAVQKDLLTHWHTALLKEAFRPTDTQVLGEYSMGWLTPTVMRELSKLITAPGDAPAKYTAAVSNWKDMRIMLSSDLQKHARIRERAGGPELTAKEQAALDGTMVVLHEFSHVEWAKMPAEWQAGIVEIFDGLSKEDRERYFAMGAEGPGGEGIPHLVSNAREWLAGAFAEYIVTKKLPKGRSARVTVKHFRDKWTAAIERVKARKGFIVQSKKLGHGEVDALMEPLLDAMQRGFPRTRESNKAGADGGGTIRAMALRPASPESGNAHDQQGSAESKFNKHYGGIINKGKAFSPKPGHEAVPIDSQITVRSSSNPTAGSKLDGLHVAATVHDAYVHEQFHIPKGFFGLAGEVGETKVLVQEKAHGENPGGARRYVPGSAVHVKDGGSSAFRAHDMASHKGLKILINFEHALRSGESARDNLRDVSTWDLFELAGHPRAEKEGHSGVIKDLITERINEMASDMRSLWDGMGEEGATNARSAGSIFDLAEIVGRYSESLGMQNVNDIASYLGRGEGRATEQLKNLLGLNQVSPVLRWLASKEMSPITGVTARHLAVLGRAMTEPMGVQGRDVLLDKSKWTESVQIKFVEEVLGKVRRRGKDSQSDWEGERRPLGLRDPVDNHIVYNTVLTLARAYDKALGEGWVGKWESKLHDKLSELGDMLVEQGMIREDIAVGLSGSKWAKHQDVRGVITETMDHLDKPENKREVRERLEKAWREEDLPKIYDKSVPESKGSMKITLDTHPEAERKGGEIRVPIHWVEPEQLPLFSKDAHAYRGKSKFSPLFMGGEQFLLLPANKHPLASMRTKDGKPVYDSTDTKGVIGMEYGKITLPYDAEIVGGKQVTHAEAVELLRETLGGPIDQSHLGYKKDLGAQSKIPRVSNHKLSADQQRRLDLGARAKKEMYILSNEELESAYKEKRERTLGQETPELGTRVTEEGTTVDVPVTTASGVEATRPEFVAGEPVQRTIDKSKAESLPPVFISARGPVWDPVGAPFGDPAAGEAATRAKMAGTPGGLKALRGMPREAGEGRPVGTQPGEAYKRKVDRWGQPEKPKAEIWKLERVGTSELSMSSPEIKALVGEGPEATRKFARMMGIGGKARTRAAGTGTTKVLFSDAAGKSHNPVLSNLYTAPFNFRGRRFKTAEGAYHAHKSGAYVEGFETIDGPTAKSVGRKVETDRAVTYDLMKEILSEKARQVPRFAVALRKSGKITHPVKDPFWAKNFPKILSEVRDSALAVTASESDFLMGKAKSYVYKLVPAKYGEYRWSPSKQEAHAENWFHDGGKGYLVKLQGRSVTSMPRWTMTQYLYNTIPEVFQHRGDLFSQHEILEVLTGRKSREDVLHDQAVSDATLQELADRGTLTQTDPSEWLKVLVRQGNNMKRVRNQLRDKRQWDDHGAVDAELETIFNKSAEIIYDEILRDGFKSGDYDIRSSEQITRLATKMPVPTREAQIDAIAMQKANHAYFNASIEIFEKMSPEVVKEINKHVEEAKKIFKRKGRVSFEDFVPDELADRGDPTLTLADPIGGSHPLYQIKHKEEAIRMGATPKSQGEGGKIRDLKALKDYRGVSDPGRRATFVARTASKRGAKDILIAPGMLGELGKKEGVPDPTKPYVPEPELIETFGFSLMKALAREARGVNVHISPDVQHEIRSPLLAGMQRFEAKAGNRFNYVDKFYELEARKRDLIKKAGWDVDAGKYYSADTHLNFMAMTGGPDAARALAADPSLLVDMMKSPMGAAYAGLRATAHIAEGFKTTRELKKKGYKRIDEAVKSAQYKLSEESQRNKESLRLLAHGDTSALHELNWDAKDWDANKRKMGLSTAPKWISQILKRFLTPGPLAAMKSEWKENSALYHEINFDIEMSSKLLRELDVRNPKSRDEVLLMRLVTAANNPAELTSLYVEAHKNRHPEEYQRLLRLHPTEADEIVPDTVFRAWEEHRAGNDRKAGPQSEATGIYRLLREADSQTVGDVILRMGGKIGKRLVDLGVLTPDEYKDAGGSAYISRNWLDALEGIGTREAQDPKDARSGYKPGLSSSDVEFIREAVKRDNDGNYSKSLDDIMSHMDQIAGGLGPKRVLEPAEVLRNVDKLATPAHAHMDIMRMENAVASNRDFQRYLIQPRKEGGLGIAKDIKTKVGKERAEAEGWVQVEDTSRNHKIFGSPTEPWSLVGKWMPKYAVNEIADIYHMRTGVPMGEATRAWKEIRGLIQHANWLGVAGRPAGHFIQITGNFFKQNAVGVPWKDMLPVNVDALEQLKRMETAREWDELPKYVQEMTKRGMFKNDEIHYMAGTDVFEKRRWEKELADEWASKPPGFHYRGFRNMKENIQNKGTLPGLLETMYEGIGVQYMNADKKISDVSMIGARKFYAAQDRMSKTAMWTWLRNNGYSEAETYEIVGASYDYSTLPKWLKAGGRSFAYVSFPYMEARTLKAMAKYNPMRVVSRMLMYHSVIPAVSLMMYLQDNPENDEDDYIRDRNNWFYVNPSMGSVETEIRTSGEMYMGLDGNGQPTFTNLLARVFPEQAIADKGIQFLEGFRGMVGERKSGMTESGLGAVAQAMNPFFARLVELRGDDMSMAYGYIDEKLPDGTHDYNQAKAMAAITGIFVPPDLEATMSDYIFDEGKFARARRKDEQAGTKGMESKYLRNVWLASIFGYRPDPVDETKIRINNRMWNERVYQDVIYSSQEELSDVISKEMGVEIPGETPEQFKNRVYVQNPALIKMLTDLEREILPSWNANHPDAEPVFMNDIIGNDPLWLWQQAMKKAFGTQARKFPTVGRGQAYKQRQARFTGVAE